MMILCVARKIRWSTDSAALIAGSRMSVTIRPTWSSSRGITPSLSVARTRRYLIPGRIQCRCVYRSKGSTVLALLLRCPGCYRCFFIYFFYICNFNAKNLNKLLCLQHRKSSELKKSINENIVNFFFMQPVLGNRKNTLHF